MRNRMRNRMRDDRGPGGPCDATMRYADRPALGATDSKSPGPKF